MGSVYNGFVVFPTASNTHDCRRNRGLETSLFNTNGTFLLRPSCTQASRIEYGKKGQKGWRGCMFWRSLTSSSIGFLPGGRVHWKLRAWVRWGGSCMCSHSGRVQYHDFIAPVTVSIRTNQHQFLKLPMDTSASEELASLGSHSSLSLYLGKVCEDVPLPLGSLLEMLGNLQIQKHAFFRLWLLSDFCL